MKQYAEFQPPFAFIVSLKVPVKQFKAELTLALRVSGTTNVIGDVRLIPSGQPAELIPPAAAVALMVYVPGDRPPGNLMTMVSFKLE